MVLGLGEITTKDGLFGTTEQYRGVQLTDTTDETGAYSITYEAKDAHAFYLTIKSVNSGYIWYYEEGSSHRIDETGTHTFNYDLHRSAYARVMIKNVPPVDTPGHLQLSQLSEHISLSNFTRDTTVFLKIVGNNNYRNVILYQKNHQRLADLPEVVAMPGDTVDLFLEY